MNCVLGCVLGLIPGFIMKPPFVSGVLKTHSRIYSHIERTDNYDQLLYIVLRVQFPHETFQTYDNIVVKYNILPDVEKASFS